MRSKLFEFKVWIYILMQFFLPLHFVEYEDATLLISFLFVVVIIILTTQFLFKGKINVLPFMFVHF